MQMRTHQEQGSGRIVRPTGLIMCLLGCLAVAALALFAPSVASAADDGTLTLVMSYESGGKTTYISGTTATAYLVADLDDNINSYTLRDEFAVLDVDFNEGLDARTENKVATKAATIVASGKIEGVSATSGTDGKASFGTLAKGVYLVLQTGAKGDAAQYSDLTPFLISVPEITEEGVVFDVVALPKVTPNPPKPPTPPTPVKPDTPSKTTPKMPQTSDLANPALWTLCFVTGALLVAAGREGLRRIRKLEESQS